MEILDNENTPVYEVILSYKELTQLKKRIGDIRNGREKVEMS